MNRRLFLALAVAAAAMPAAASDNGPSCSNQTTRGSWVYTCEGTLPTMAQTNTRLLGSCVATRQGYFTCSGNANLGGQVLTQTLEGQANTAPNCTGTITYANTVGGQPAGTLDIYFVVSRNGDVIDGLPTNSGGVLACKLHRISGG